MKDFRKTYLAKEQFNSASSCTKFPRNALDLLSTASKKIYRIK